MAQIISQPDLLSFSSSLDDLVVSTSYDSATVVLDLLCSGSRLTLLNERYHADNGTIRLSDLSDLVQPYVRQYLRATMECTITDNDGDVSISPVTVLFGLADVGMTAAEFTSSHFLTVLDGEKITAMDRDERLYAYGAGTVTVNAEVMQPDGTLETITRTIEASATTNGISQFDVSPRRIASIVDLIGGRLYSFSIIAGNRCQQYRCVIEQVPPEPSLLFVNSFGCEELIHCCGTLKRSSKFERQSGHVAGRLRNYLVTESRTFGANTGWLNDAMADWAEDLFRSDEVYLWNGARGKSIVLSDSKSETTNEEDEMTSYEFSYVYAQRSHNVIIKRKAARIFTETFEEIYN